MPVEVEVDAGGGANQRTKLDYELCGYKKDVKIEHKRWLAGVETDYCELNWAARVPSTCMSVAENFITLFVYTKETLITNLCFVCTGSSTFIEFYELTSQLHNDFGAFILFIIYNKNG